MYRLNYYLPVSRRVLPKIINTKYLGGFRGAFKSDKLMDALFQEGQSAPQTPQTFFDADLEGLASKAELYIFNQEDSQE